MSREYCVQLLEANTISEVDDILSELESRLDVDWEPIGEKRNNRGLINAQTPHPVASLTELTANSNDAVLHRLYREKFEKDEWDPDSGVETYADGERVLISDTSEEIQIVADGEQGISPNLTIRDRGIGQSRSDFEESFFGMLEAGARKREWPFQQGQFGMGSKAVLKHCGGPGYKLVISASHLEPSEWSWSITREHTDLFQYEYLCKGEGVFEFDGALEGQDFGTFVKVFEYDYGSVGHIGTYLRKRLIRSLWRTPVPIEMVEDREDVRGTYSKTTTTKGGFQYFERYDDLIERDYTISQYDFGDRLGKRDIRIVVAKPDADLDGSQISQKRRWITGTKTDHRDEAVFFTVNGQTHGSLGETFIKNRCKKHKIGKDVMVFMDFSDFSADVSGYAEIDDLFVSGRYRLNESDLAHQLVSALEEAIGKDKTLDKLEEQRRKRAFREEDEERRQDLITEILERNPSIKRWLKTGDKAGTVGQVNPSEDFNPPFIPTTFNVIKKYRHDGSHEIWRGKEGRFVRREAINRNAWLYFELDAPDEYFRRDDRPGDIHFYPNDIVKHFTLTNGVLYVELRPRHGAEVGDTIPLTVEIERPPDNSLECSIKVEYVEEAKSTPKPPSESESEPREEEYDLPESNWIYEEDWDEWEGFDEHTIVEVWDEEDGLVFNINVDAAPIRNFLVRHNIKENYQTMVTNYWDVGIRLYGVGQYLELQNNFEQNVHLNGLDATDIIEVSMRGIAQTMLDQHISEDLLDDMTA